MNQVWSLDFVTDQLSDGGRLGALTGVDIYTWESLAIEVRQSQQLEGTWLIPGGISAVSDLKAEGSG